MSGLEVVGAIGAALGTTLVIYVVAWMDEATAPAPSPTITLTPHLKRKMSGQAPPERRAA
jgi:hypothetical protein